MILDFCVDRTIGVPEKLLEFGNFFPDPGKLLEKQLFSLYSWNSPEILWRIIMYYIILLLAEASDLQLFLMSTQLQDVY